MTCSGVFNEEGGGLVGDLASLRWLSPDRPAPAAWERVGDQTRADVALALARKGRGLLYQGGYHGARQLLAGMGRRLRSYSQSRSRSKAPRAGTAPTGASALLALFLSQRELARLEHELLCRLCVPVSDGYKVLLHRAPDVHLSCEEALGPWDAGQTTGALPLRDLLGMVGAHEWRRRGVEVRALDGRVHPHYGVYAPVRPEYVDLVSRAVLAWPVEGKRALDLGTGTGVLAFVLARHGATVLATDLEPRAVRCARENAERLLLLAAVEVREADLFPGEKVDLVVANPPWLPAPAHSALERAVYDPGGAFLERLVAGIPGALRPGGEAWVVISDLAERLGLRPASHLERLFGAAGLVVGGTLEAHPAHPRTQDEEDPLYEARSGEIVRLLRLLRA